MPDIQVKIKNLPAIRRAFSMSPRLMTKELNIAIAKSILTVKGDSQRETPVDTGRLRASTYTQMGNLRGEVGTRTNYDIFVHEGTRYMKGRPYLKMAVNKDERQINDYFTRAVQNVLNAIGRAV